MSKIGNFEIKCSCGSDKVKVSTVTSRDDEQYTRFKCEECKQQVEL